MASSPPALIHLQIDSRGPIGGWLETRDDHPERFDGWLQLLSLLQRTIDETDPQRTRDA